MPKDPVGCIYNTMASELANILSHVGDTGNVKEYLKRRGNPGPWNKYRLRVMEKPLPGQSATRRLLGLAAVAGATYFTVTQGISAYYHYETIINALGNMQSTLHNLNIFNALPSGQHVLNDLQTVQNNILPATVDGAKTFVGFNADITAAVVLRPWKKSKRRGIILGAL